MQERAPAEPTVTPGAPSSTMEPGFSWFVGGVASWFAAFGMQSAVFSWLLVGVLDQPAEWVGVAQTANMLPSLVLLLFGGALADRYDPRRGLVWIHLIAVLPVLVLAAAVAGGTLTVYGLIGFALCQGTVNAFAMPARDSLLSRVSGSDMMRAVTWMTAAQFGFQSLGTLAAGAADWVGTTSILLLQALVLGLGGLVMLRVPSVEKIPSQRVALRETLGEIAEGLRLVADTPNLRLPLLLVLAVGMLFVGPFIVLIPLIVREVYQGTAQQLAFVLSLFPIGTIAGSLVILMRGGVQRKGLAALRALVIGSLALASIGLGLPFWGMVLASFLWGMCGAFFINCSRTLFQEAAPAAQRGRVLAVYQFGFSGSAPIGALAAGFGSAWLGLLPTLIAFGATMLVVVTCAAIFTDARHMR
ncbi:MAG: MFS transporter [bacterium]|nr:MFS transporter [bacterium]